MYIPTFIPRYQETVSPRCSAIIHSRMTSSSSERMIVNSIREKARRFVLTLFRNRKYKKNVSTLFSKDQHNVYMYGYDRSNKGVLAVLTSHIEQHEDVIELEELRIPENDADELKWNGVKLGEKEAKGTGVDFVMFLIDMCKKMHAETVVLITDELSNPAIKCMRQCQDVYFTRFTYEEASVDHTQSHILYPSLSHRALREDEMDHFRATYHTRENICKWSRFDPFVKYFGYKPGDILRVHDADVEYVLVDDN
jgi:DNA-directed RNA polymerase subunit H (RpoH/RPB5)